MGDLFSVRWLAAERLLSIEMHGFWGEELVDAFTRRLVAATTGIGTAGFDVLADLSGLVPQSAVVVERQAGVVEQLAAAGMKRVAVVGAGALLSRQVSRAAQPVSLYFAADHAAALRWLRADGGERMAPPT